MDIKSLLVLRARKNTVLSIKPGHGLEEMGFLTEEG